MSSVTIKMLKQPYILEVEMYYSAHAVANVFIIHCVLQKLCVTCNVEMNV